MHRIAVVYNDKPLMPMKISRSKRFVKEGKGVLKYNKLGIPYLQLINEPSGYNLQEIVISYDPGSAFDGITVGSKEAILQNINHEVSTKHIIKKLEKKSMYRRTRRGRLRRRPVRFDSRTSKNQIAPSQKSKWLRRLNILNLLRRLYPISTVIIEDVCFNHYKKRKGKSFSHVEIGKNWFRKKIRALNLNIVEYKGFETKKIRDKYNLEKIKSLAKKGTKAWNAHIVDSYAMICKYFNKLISTTKVFIQLKYRDIARRELIREKQINKNSKLPRFKKVKLYRKHFIKSNDLKFNKGIKKLKTNYGGTASNGCRKFGVYLTDRGLGIIEKFDKKYQKIILKTNEKINFDNNFKHLGYNRWIITKIIN